MSLPALSRERYFLNKLHSHTCSTTTGQRAQFNAHFSVMALKGVKVVEMAGLAPAPFCGMILSDFGASVLRVDRVAHGNQDRLNRGKRSVAVNLKSPAGLSVVSKLCANADVLIEPFRPGVMERLGLGPRELMAKNPRLVYARLTGFGQTGPLKDRAGHDINYVAMSGVLSLLGRAGSNPTPPVNLLADFAGGGLTCALGILLALFHRTKSGQGQVVDSSMVEGAAYVSSFLFAHQGDYLFAAPRGHNFLDTGTHFYDVYETKDGGHMSVGALEPQFYSQFLAGLGFTEDEMPQMADFAAEKAKVAARFKEKTRDEWTKIFGDTDACVQPVLTTNEAAEHPLSKHRNAFVKGVHDQYEPVPAPQLSATPGEAKIPSTPLQVGQHTREILLEMGYSASDIKKMEEEGAIEINPVESKI